MGINKHESPLYGWINFVEGEVSMKDALYNDLEYFTSKGFFSKNKNSEYQVYGATQRNIIEKLNNNGDLKLIDIFTYNRTNIYSKFGLDKVDNTLIEELKVKYKILNVENKVHEKVEKINELNFVEEKNDLKSEEFIVNELEDYILKDEINKETGKFLGKYENINNSSESEVIIIKDSGIKNTFGKINQNTYLGGAGVAISLALFITFLNRINKNKYKKILNNDIENGYDILEKSDKLLEKIKNKFSNYKKGDHVFLIGKNHDNSINIPVPLEIGKYIKTNVNPDTYEITHEILDKKGDKKIRSEKEWKLKKYKGNNIYEVEKIMDKNEVIEKKIAIYSILALNDPVIVKYKEGKIEKTIKGFYEGISGRNLKIVDINNLAEYIPLLLVDECLSNKV